MCTVHRKVYGMCTYARTISRWNTIHIELNWTHFYHSKHIRCVRCVQYIQLHYTHTHWLTLSHTHQVNSSFLIRIHIKTVPLALGNSSTLHNPNVLHRFRRVSIRFYTIFSIQIEWFNEFFSRISRRKWWWRALRFFRFSFDWCVVFSFEWKK